MDQAQRKELGLPPDDDFNMADEKSILDMEEPALGSKAKSQMPITKAKAGVQLSALKAVGDSDMDDTQMLEEKSQVFQKRDRLFTVLTNVQLDVQHAANLWMLEERLKRVDTISKAKDLSQRHDKPIPGIRTQEEAEELADRFNSIADEEMQEMMDQIGSKLD